MTAGNGGMGGLNERTYLYYLESRPRVTKEEITRNDLLRARNAADRSLAGKGRIKQNAVVKHGHVAAGADAAAKAAYGRLRNANLKEQRQKLKPRCKFCPTFRPKETPHAGQSDSGTGACHACKKIAARNKTTPAVLLAQMQASPSGTG